MQQKILNYYLEYSLFTNPGLYEEYLQSLSDDVQEIGLLVRKNFIHRTTLDAGNTGTNADLKYGDMKKVPWYRQAEDDILTTTVSIMAELFRRDSKGLTLNRKPEDKLVLSCRYVAVLLASILKSKKIPARVRAGFGDYFEDDTVAWDHWINQYWSYSEDRWVTIDVDGSLHRTGFDMYDIPDGKFNWAADTWLGIRTGKIDENHYHNAADIKGLITVAWQLFYDFHCLMNSEILYIHRPRMVRTVSDFKKNTEKDLSKIDTLARLMQNPDDNFEQLQKIWNTNREFRLLKGGLL